MDNAEYERLYRLTRNNTFPRLTRETMKELSNVYRMAADQMAETIRKAELTGAGKLTMNSLNAIDDQLFKAGTRIATAVEKDIPLLVTDAYSRYARIDNTYILDAVKRAGAGDLITSVGMDRVAGSVNDAMITALVNRSYADGYNFSDRIWGLFDENDLPFGIHGDYQYRIKNVINSGLAQNRDVIKIARDVQVYTADGKIALANRYGKLVRGSGEFRKRIADRVDWRALRLVRSELYASLQQAAVMQGKTNPAGTGMYNWRLTPGAMHECICPALADGSPYKEEDIPSYPHPNCLCSITPVLRPTKEFVDDLTEWTEGGQVPYLENWYSGTYLPVNLN